MTTVQNVLYHTILIFLMSTIAQGQTPSPQMEPSQLAYADLPTLEEANAQSSVVLLGTVTVVGNYDFRGKGVLAYDNATAKITTLYKGTITPPIKLHVRVSRPNDAPVEGSQYVFFILEKAHRNFVILFLPGTEGNIAKVKALLASASAAKAQ